MEKLNQLAQIVSGIVTPENARILFKEGNSDPKAYVLFDGVLRNKFPTDDAAAWHLYRSQASSKKYQMLKSRVRKKLIQLVFTMDPGKRIKSTYTKALHDCNRNLFAARQLISLGHRNLISDILMETFSLANKHGFTEIKLSLARLIRDHEVFVGNAKSVQGYSEIIDQLIIILRDEVESEKYYQLIRSFFRFTKNVVGPSMQAVKDCYLSMIKLRQEIKEPSNMIVGNYYRVSIYYFHLTEEHMKVIEECNEFEAYLLNNKQYLDFGVMAEINIQKLDTALYLRKHDIGKESAEKCARTFGKGVTNWFVVQELYFLLCLHTQKYTQAYSVFNEVKSIKSQNKFSVDRIERWKIFEAFLTYILPTDKRRKQFNVHRFVNEVPVFSKDKIGYNFSIIVAQVILLVKAGDFDRVMDKYESLKSYARRYISLDRSPRSYYFVKMLLTMIKYDFDPVKTESISAKFFDKLCAARIGNQGELETLEVIPYDILWPDLLKKLRKHKSNMIAV